MKTDHVHTLFTYFLEYGYLHCWKYNLFRCVLHKLYMYTRTSTLIKYHNKEYTYWESIHPHPQWSDHHNVTFHKHFIIKILPDRSHIHRNASWWALWLFDRKQSEFMMMQMSLLRRLYSVLLYLPRFHNTYISRTHA